ncbi:MAG: zinc-finger domain-containing protein [Novosphingobium sp.]|nr:zinc-finger domain-containing protein [Novosphingobium sp.]
MIDPPEIVYVDQRRVKCDGAGDIPAALGHPRVWLEIDDSGFIDCSYCDRRFVLRGSPAERGDRELAPGYLPEPGDGSVA